MFLGLRRKGFYATHCLSEMEVARSPRSLKICALKRTREAAFRFCPCLKKPQENHHQQFIAEDFRRLHLMIRDIAKFDTAFLKPSISRVSSPPKSGTSRFPHHDELIGFQPASGSPVP